MLTRTRARLPHPRRAVRVHAAVWVLLLAGVLRLLYGAPHLGYDAWWALVWGDQLAGGHLPALEGAVAPTPHPLAIVAGAPLTLLGDGAPAVVAAIGLISFAACGAAAFVLGRRLFGTVAGVAAALLLLTRALLVAETLYCSLDLTFLALVLGAGACVVAERPRRRAALVLLVLAGLLRPEGWGLAIVAAGAWLWRERERADRRVAVAAAVAAPLLWMAFDLACTGDPLHSLHGTQELADTIGRPQSLGTAIDVLPSYLTVVLGHGAAIAGGVAALAALWIALERAALPLAALALGLLAFLVLGVAGLPLLYRYTMLPAAALALLAGWALVAWRDAPAGTHARTAMAAGAGAVIVAILATTPGDLRALRDTLRRSADRHRTEEQLTRVLRAPAVGAVLARCAGVSVPHHRPVPQVAYLLHRSPDDVVVPAGQAPRGVALTPVPGAAAFAFVLTGRDQPTIPATALRAFGTVASNSAWIADARC